jgi:hypothetical protein
MLVRWYMVPSQMNRVTWNHDPTVFSLPSSYDDRYEAPRSNKFFLLSSFTLEIEVAIFGKLLFSCFEIGQ